MRARYDESPFDILSSSPEQIAALQGQLAGFAAKLREEEDQSRLVRRMPMW